VLGLSLVSNHAAGVKNEPLRHEDVTRAAAAGSDALRVSDRSGDRIAAAREQRLKARRSRGRA